MNLKCLFNTLISVFFILIPMYSSAHGIWFAERSRTLALIYGEGADDLAILKRQHKIQSFKAFGASWKTIDTQLIPSGPLLIVKDLKKVKAVSAVLDNGRWSKLKNGRWLPNGRDVSPSAVLSEHTFKYAVHLRDGLANIPKLHSQKLQIIPVGKKFPTQKAQSVKFQVLYDGQPVKGAVMKADYINNVDAKPLYTDSNGYCILPIRNQGLNVIAAIYSSEPGNKKIVDKLEHLATLSFVLPHLPE